MPRGQSTLTAQSLVFIINVCYRDCSVSRWGGALGRAELRQAGVGPDGVEKRSSSPPPGYREVHLLSLLPGTASYHCHWCKPSSYSQVSPLCPTSGNPPGRGQSRGTADRPPPHPKSEEVSVDTCVLELGEGMFQGEGSHRRGTPRTRG